MFPQARYKLAAVSIATFLSLYLLLPSLMSWTGHPLSPSVAQFFPEKALHLGLDLKGGVYLEFDIDLAAAASNRADLLHTELERAVARENLKIPKIERLPNAPQIQVTLPADDAAQTAFDKIINDTFRHTLNEIKSARTATTRVYGLNESYLNNLNKTSLDQALETVRHRIDKYGVSEPSIQKVGDNRIIVELPDEKNPDRVIQLIKQAGHLEFKLVDTSMPQTALLEMVAKFRTEQKIQDFSTATLERIQNELAPQLPPESELRFEVHRNPTDREITGATPYLLKKKAELTGDMLTDAQVQFENNRPYASLTFNDLGAKVFADVTGKNIGKPLAILLDGVVNSAPNINSKIPDGRAQITFGSGDYDTVYAEAKDLTLVLREGALPATLTERAKTVVGPSLGQQSIERAMQAMIFSAAIVIAFMILYYRMPGLWASLALVVNVLFIFAALSLFGATLTLPGLAGIVLTMGMAVDANIIVFERVREEMNNGKSFKAALESGYQESMSAIVDANATTFLAGAILYQFGTGPIRGFAVTLMVGILTTMITAMLVTKWLQEGFANVSAARSERTS